MAKKTTTSPRASDFADTYWGYRTKYIVKKRVGGRWVSWDTRTDKPADFNKIKDEFRVDFKERSAISQQELKQHPLSLTQLRKNIGDRLISHDTEVGVDGRPLTINQVKTFGKRMNPNAIEGFDTLNPRQEYEFRKMLRIGGTSGTLTPSSAEKPSDGSGSTKNNSLAIGPTEYDAKAAGGLQAWYRGGPRTLKQANADSAAYFQKSGWDKALKGVGKRDMQDIAKAFRGGYATVFTNKGGKDFLHYKGRVYSKPTQGG